MLRIHTSTNTKAVENYYNSGLSKEDYYTEKGDIIGKWYGKASKKLGLSGDINQEEFKALIHNQKPISKEQITPRNNSNRRIGYDINFHAPKSVSIAYNLTQDENILNSFREAVKETMIEIEKKALTMVRKNGAAEKRETGNIVYGEFIHFTARPVDGKIDPHLHAHCFTFNCTYDEKEQRFKALQNENIKNNAPYFEARFHASFSKQLEENGYTISRTKQNWELKGISQEAIKEFSQRTKQIEEFAIKRDITDAKQKAELGAKTRQKKDKKLSWNELTEQWNKRLNDEDKEGFNNLKKQSTKKEDLNYMIKETALNVFERKSVIEDLRFKALVMKRAVGQYKPKEIEKAISEMDFINNKFNGKNYLTTKKIVTEENAMLEFAVKGKGCYKPFTTEHQLTVDFLNSQQKEAIKHIHHSRDTVTIIEGGAGVGKTTLMKEVVYGIEKNGKNVIPLAPSAQASRGVMRNEGFNNADTIARFLIDKEMQKKAKNNVIWIDEAGMVGTRTMAQIFKIAETNKTRVILTGDSRQHSSVERGDAMRLLKEKGAIKSPKVTEILRQKGAYKKAVSDISNGDILDGFYQLSKLGAIETVKDDERYKKLANDYIEIREAKKKVLVIAPTHAEGKKVTDEIRASLKKSGLLAKKEMKITALKNLHLTEGEKKDILSYEKGIILQTIQNIPQIKRGSKFEVTGNVKENKIELINTEGETTFVDTLYSNRFNLYQPQDINLAQGDKIRITQNGFAQRNDKKLRLDNGSIHEIKEVSTKGNIILKNGATIQKDYGHISHGYVVTSHASQGKTVNTVLVAQSSQSFTASNAKQFYVSVSRGKEKVKIYTDNKEDLLKSIKNDTKRLGASELQEPKTSLRQTINKRLEVLGNIYTSYKSKWIDKIGKKLYNEKTRPKINTQNFTKGR